ncbi:EAL domain-containing protein [Paenibacillus chartarius]|uniref:EAL domain-containing protein n=1 Tax=Paenibacillus chartarius TaxID=747481 RepID=A0ABV6DRM6_9BACL
MGGFHISAVRIMNRLKYWQKFVLIGTLFLLPIVQTEYLLFSGIDKEIRFAKNERMGIEYANHIRNLLEALQQHRGIVNAFLSGDASFQEMIVRQQNEIEHSIITIDKVDRELDRQFHTTVHWSSIKRKWVQLKQNLQRLQPQESFGLHSELIQESYQLHTSIVSNLLALIGTIKDASGLRIDPDHDSYYLMDVIIGKLPSVMETVGQTRGIGVGVAARRAITEEERTQLLILSGMIRTFMKDLADMPVVFENTGLQDDLHTHIRETAAETNAFLDELNEQIIHAANITISPSEFFERATKVIDSGFRLYDAESPVLDRLLQQRIHHLQAKKQYIALFSCLIILLLLYLFVTFHISVLQTVLALKKAAVRIVGGDLTTRVDIDSKDELGHVSIAFNKMIEAFDSMIAERARHEKQIEQLAFFDALTGLPNRVLFNERLEHALAAAEKNNHMLAVMFLDLDRFKHINDTLGHEAGDVLLKTVADRLTRCLRHDDLVSRMGGDEFMLFIPGIKSIGEVRVAAESIIGRFAEPIVVNGHELVVSVSIGISLYPFDGNSRDGLIKSADMAMYKAKGEGRNTFRIYDSSLHAMSTERLRLEVNLRRALERGEFTIYYQPRIGLTGGTIAAMEALVRWQHPESGLVSPAEFIPLAEEIGLIVPLGEWILETACRQNKRWQDDGMDPFRISVNISAVQFHRDEFVKVVQRALQEASLEPQWLELELTESIVMNNAAKTIMKLRELKEAGVHISIDDFGTGFSSLSYLKYFPIDTLKIDRSFLQDVPDSPKDIAIIKTIIALARRLHLNVVAEGVESREQFLFLAARKCSEGQGYFFSRPMPASEAEQWIRDSSAEWCSKFYIP